MKWLLVLILTSPPHGFSHSTLIVDSGEECRAKGETWNKTTTTIIKNPDSGWNRAVLRRASYQCILCEG